MWPYPAVTYLRIAARCFAGIRAACDRLGDIFLADEARDREESFYRAESCTVPRFLTARTSRVSFFDYAGHVPRH